MEQEFQTVLMRVLAIGIPMAVIGTVAIIFIFRAFAPERSEGSDRRAAVGIIAVLAFVIVCCMVLLIISFPKRNAQMTPLARSAAIARFV